MKALSLWQPWATLILDGSKTIETRTWGTRYRGPVLIHASRTVDQAACRQMRVPPSIYVRGCIVGRAWIATVEPFTPDLWEDLRPRHLVDGPLDPPRFGWWLTRIQRIETPIPWRGALGLFEIPDQVVGGAVWLG